MTTYMKEYYQKHKETIKSRALENKKIHKEKAILQNKDSRLKRKYGISLEDYNNLFDKQQGCCAICGEHQSLCGDGRSLAVDHCHTTGQVRELLCNFCNTGLGIYEKYKDNFEKYLLKHKDGLKNES